MSSSDQIEPSYNPSTVMPDQLARHKSPTVQHLKSYDRAMCEATLGISHHPSSKPSKTINPTISDPPSPPRKDTLVPPHLQSPDEKTLKEAKMGLTTFEDPLGLGLGTLPTSEHADKMVKQGERKIKLGTILHSGRLQQQGQTLLAKAELVRTHAIDLPPQERRGTSPGQP